MSRIRGKDTRPEMIVRKALHARGLRYTLENNGMPGRPDLVFPRFGAAVFVHGCFWHSHQGCRLATTPASNTEFWGPKLARNVERDAAVREELASSGKRVAIVWECSLGRSASVEDAADRLADWLRTGGQFLEIGDPRPPKGR